MVVENLQNFEMIRCLVKVFVEMKIVEKVVVVVVEEKMLEMIVED